jgi:hypothetical protein
MYYLVIFIISKLVIMCWDSLLYYHSLWLISALCVSFRAGLVRYYYPHHYAGLIGICILYIFLLLEITKWEYLRVLLLSMNIFWCFYYVIILLVIFFINSYVIY